MRRLRRQSHDVPGALRTLESHVTADFRRTVVFGLVALAALVGGERFGRIDAHGRHAQIGAWVCAFLVVVFGVLTSRSAAAETERIIAARATGATASGIRLIVLLTGYVITLFAVLDLLALPVNYFTGGTVAALIIGIAAQQVLGNVFAGLVLLFARPYVPGERVRVFSGALGGPHEGVVTGVGLLYTTVERDDGVINIPNSALLASAVGPGPAEEDDAADEDEIAGSPS